MLEIFRKNILFVGEGVLKSLAHGPKYQIKNRQKIVQNSAHKRLFSKKSGTISKNVLEKNSRAFGLHVRAFENQ